MPPIHRLLLLAASLGTYTAVVASPTQQVLAPLEESPDPLPLYSSRKIHGRFLHITDFHPDEFYKAHTSTQSGVACHRKSGAAGAYGAETSDCDSPISLVNATFDWIAANLNDSLDFVIWTGDSARHDSDEKNPRNKDQVLGTNRLLAHKFGETFVDKMGIPVIPTFGNNDILPHNIMMPGPNKWLGYYTDMWKKFIPEEQKHSFQHGGWFFVEVVPKNLVVFSLNTLYFFDRNAAVDDCVRPSEPGFHQMEWLRVQLQFLRERGMKAILMGHVPPARTDSKQNWDETCWQKYTLWLRQFRDVVVGAVYGHMNIDHFMFQDTEDLSFEKLTVEYGEQQALARLGQVKEQDDEFGAASASDYLHELRTNWGKLPNPIVAKALEEEFEEDSMSKNGDKKKNKKNKKTLHERLGGKWAERYQLTMIGPSIVPNYFPTLRVIEYNITGLEDHVTWADALERPELFSTASGLFNLDYDEMEEVLELLEEEDETEVESEDDEMEIEKKKKKKKSKKRKKMKPDPNLIIPDAPSKSSLPGPAYSAQSLTLTGYTQYLANLTWINNDMLEPGEKRVPGTKTSHSPTADAEAEAEEDSATEGEEVDAERWRDGIHKDRKPKQPKAKPHDFEYQVEYSTFDDGVYKLKDMTVRSYVHLAYRIGKEEKKGGAGGKGLGLVGDAELKDEDFEDDSDFKDDHEDGDEDGEEGDSEDEDEDVVDAEKKKKKKGDENKKGKKGKGKKGKGKKGKGKKGKGKKKKHRPHSTNKVWMEFLNRAFVSTLDRGDLKKFGFGPVMVAEAEDESEPGVVEVIEEDGYGGYYGDGEL